MAEDISPIAEEEKNHDDSLKLDHQLCFSLYSTSRLITKQYAVLLNELKITYPQYLVLLVLWENDGLTVQEIARSLELEGATTTPLIQRMEKLGLVDRKRSVQDERKVNVFLSKKGMSLRLKAMRIPHTIACSLGIDKKKAKEVMAHLNAIKAFVRSH